MKPLFIFFSFLILYLFFSFTLLEASQHQALSEDALQPEDSRRERSSWELKEKSSGGARRLMIGSIAPHCTYNECRGCRFKCQAEQVPVDANDPMNTSYRYLCVCHR
ncbi:hypothetical protein IEQ34_001443 [Dendrobium chrysotoxum]|uniref:Stomagen C-terminal domain-containing protein n=1 Tax=Dendrobium chrysotoxum TaxID=161865 RepID=A0AAV7HP37_DENCH|nr:hypothetical protein IEQ34_001443 [Dendrobium chrysotoxum]